MSDTMSLQEAANISGYDESSVRYKIHRGYLKATRNAHGKYRISVEAVRELTRLPKYTQSKPIAR